MQNGYYLNKTGDRVNQLLSRQFIVPTLDNSPTTGTRSWIDGEYLVDFRIGELCRVKENNEWVFYRLQDIDGSIYIWVKVDASKTPDLSGYYTKEETNSKIDEKVQSIEFPEDQSIKYATRAEYEALKELGSVSDKTLYVIMEGEEPVELLIGIHQIAVKDLGSKGFPYSFPIIF